MLRAATLFFIILAAHPAVGWTGVLSSTPRHECVILIHGLGRSSFSLKLLEGYLKGEGYKTVSLDYSVTQSIEEVAEEQVAAAVAQCRAQYKADQIHFVTHSLGGIIVRYFLQKHELPSGSRLVMLAPPNQGSELADILNRLSVSRIAPIPAWRELGTGPKSLPNQLKPIAIKVGVIAGNRSLNPLFSALIPGPDDGKVSLARTTLPEMADFLVVPSSHPYLLWRFETILQTAYFLKCGRFAHPRVPASEK